MDLFEHQAKELFAKHGVPTSPGEVAYTADEVERIATEIGKQVVVKAQVKVGGRGKAGGVKLADTPAEAKVLGEQILGMDIKGHTVHKVLVNEATDIAQEYYISFLLDRSNRTFLAMCSVEGGVEIEVTAEENPDALAKLPVSALDGVSLEYAREIAVAGRLPENVLDKAAYTIKTLWDTFVGEDATLVEVNPLVQTPDGDILALDGKVTLDDNSLFRHPDQVAMIDTSAVDPLETKAKSLDLNYVKLDGEVGIIGNGAGLVMSTLDVVTYAGESQGGVKPANFLDIGGGASAQVMANGLGIILGDPAVKSVFANIFGGITACDAVANGIVQAVGMIEGGLTKPIVVRLDGNNAAQGRAILDGAGIPLLERVDTMDGAAARAAELANSGKA